MTNLNKEGNTVELSQNEAAVGVPSHEVERTDANVDNFIHVHTILRSRNKSVKSTTAKVSINKSICTILRDDRKSNGQVCQNLHNRAAVHQSVIAHGKDRQMYALVL